VVVGAIVVALAFAFVLGVSDAPNATAALVGTGTARYWPAMAFSFVFHVIGGLVSGTAVALTVTGMIDVGGRDAGAAYTAGGLAAVVFVLVATRLGLPTSASFGLVGGLVGAAFVAGGTSAIVWGGFDGLHPYGVVGALVAMLISPFIGALAGGAARKLVAISTRRASRRVERPVRGALWTASALVAVSDGSNDGQKAMGIIVGAMIADGTLHHFAVPIWARVSVALVLAAGTALGGRRLVRTVGRRLYRQRELDGLAAQTGAALAVLGAAWAGAPVSTSSVVTASVVGVGLERRRRHVRWPLVGATVTAWIVTVPVCALLGGLAFLATRLLP
jgi:PiT family inorganic phosphate transporter